MTSQDNDVTSQVHAMTAKVNRDVGPQIPHHVNNMASRWRGFTRMQPLIFFRPKENEDPQDFLHKVYKFLYVMGVTSIENQSLGPIKTKM